MFCGIFLFCYIGFVTEVYGHQQENFIVAIDRSRRMEDTGINVMEFVSDLYEHMVPRRMTHLQQVLVVPYTTRVLLEEAYLFRVYSDDDAEDVQDKRNNLRAYMDVLTSNREGGISDTAGVVSAAARLLVGSEGSQHIILVSACRTNPFSEYVSEAVGMSVNANIKVTSVMIQKTGSEECASIPFSKMFNVFVSLPENAFDDILGGYSANNDQEPENDDNSSSDSSNADLNTETDRNQDGMSGESENKTTTSSSDPEIIASIDTEATTSRPSSRSGGKNEISEENLIPLQESVTRPQGFDSPPEPESTTNEQVDGGKSVIKYPLKHVRRMPYKPTIRRPTRTRMLRYGLSAGNWFRGIGIRVTRSLRENPSWFGKRVNNVRSFIRHMGLYGLGIRKADGKGLLGLGRLSFEFLKRSTTTMRPSFGRFKFSLGLGRALQSLGRLKFRYLKEPTTTKRPSFGRFRFSLGLARAFQSLGRLRFRYLKEPTTTKRPSFGRFRFGLGLGRVFQAMGRTTRRRRFMFGGLFKRHRFALGPFGK